MTLKAPSDEADTPLVSEFPLVNKEIVVAVDAQGKPVALDDDRRPVRTVNPQGTSTVIPEIGSFYFRIARPGFAPQLQSLDLKSGSGATRLVTEESLPPDVLSGLKGQSANKEIVVAVDAQGKPVALDDDRRPVRTVNPQDTSTVIPETGIFYSLIARPGFAPQLQSLDLKSGSGVTTLVTKESLPPDVLTGLRTQLLTALASQSE